MVDQEFMQEKLDNVKEQLIAEFREGQDLDEKIREVEKQIEDIEDQMPIENEEEWYKLLNSLEEELDQIRQEAKDIQSRVSRTNGHLGKITRKFAEKNF